MFISIVLLIASTFTWTGQPTTPIAPTGITIGAPIITTDSVTIPITISNPDCCNPMTFAIPGFDPTWGTCAGTSVGLDWETTWFSGIEYISVTHAAIGRMCTGWYPDDHEGQLWPDRDDIGTPGGNFWKGAISLITDDGPHLMHATITNSLIAYVKNDDGVHPRGPHDNYPGPPIPVDYVGRAGGNYSDADPQDPVEYGPEQQISVTAPTIRMVLDCAARCCFIAKILGQTQLTIQSYAKLHIEVRYALQ